MELQKDCTAPELLGLLPLDEISEIATNTEVDYKAKKITGIRMMSMMIVSFLSTTRLSQRYIGEELCNHEFSKLFKISLADGKVTHSSVSHRLDTMPTLFFKKSYQCVINTLQKLLPAEYLEDRYVMCDSSMVTDTASILKNGMETGKKDSQGGHRKQLKYSMAVKGFDVTVAKILSQQKALSEDIALARTVKRAIRISGKGDIFLFDRGCSSFSNLVTILDLANKKNATFIGRLKSGRKYTVKKKIDTSEGKSNEDVEIIEDTESFLCDARTKELDKRHRFRIIRAKLLRVRPRKRRKTGTERRREHEILLITNDFKSSALDICDSYKKRWNIEVFFKFLKQNLSFGHLLSSSINGLTIVLYMMLITAALVKIFEILNDLGPRIAILRMKLQLDNWIMDHPLPADQNNVPHTPMTEKPPA